VAIVLSVLLWYKASDYWDLWYLQIFLQLSRLEPLISSSQDIAVVMLK
jgi:hypothetical protein